MPKYGQPDIEPQVKRLRKDMALESALETIGNSPRETVPGAYHLHRERSGFETPRAITLIALLILHALGLGVPALTTGIFTGEPPKAYFIFGGFITLVSYAFATMYKNFLQDAYSAARRRSGRTEAQPQAEELQTAATLDKISFIFMLLSLMTLAAGIAFLISKLA